MERSRFCAACGAALTPTPVPGERRKVVTVVFADVVGSTELGERVDAETLRWAMQRWFAAMGQTVERHGGTVERYVGDALMAVFGIPVAHEDDALRAVRTALDMRDEVAELHEELLGARGVELAVRIGLNTGEAVTGAAVAGGSFTTGDAVNVAARLEQAGPAGEVPARRPGNRRRAAGAGAAAGRDPARPRHAPAGRARRRRRTGGAADRQGQAR